MEGAMLSILIIAAIAVAVFLGYKTKINTGLFCIVFAYIIGCLFMGLKPKTLIGYWPTNTMFVILGVSLFYNVAAANGTLEKISRSLLYACRKFPGLLPYALFFVAVVLSVMDKLTGAVAINCGALAGGDFPTAALGVVFRGLMDTAYEATPELTALESFSTEMVVFALAIVFSLLLITVFRVAIKQNRNIGKGITFQKPEAYTDKQKKTPQLILIMMAVVLVFPLLKVFMPGVKFISNIAGKIDVGLVAVIFAVIALLMDLAPQKEIIAKVPWNTIIMIAGAGMLIAVAVEAGTIKMLSNWIGANVPPALIPIAFSIVAAFMSFFSSTTGVVTPALFPLIPALAATAGINPAVLFTCTVLGAQSSAISPFSSGGSLILGGCNNEEQRNQLFNRLMFVAVPTSICLCAVYNMVVSFIL